MSSKATHHLSWDEPQPTWDEVVKAIDEIIHPDGSLTGWTEELLNGTPSNWEQPGPDLEEMSTRWPNVLFTLGCANEDGERWVIYAKGGLHYDAECETPPFNEEILKGTTSQAVYSSPSGITMSDQAMAVIWDNRKGAAPSALPWDILEKEKRAEIAQQVLNFIEEQLANSLQIDK